MLLAGKSLNGMNCPLKFDIVIRRIRKEGDRVLQQKMYLPKPIRCWNILTPKIQI